MIRSLLVFVFALQCLGVCVQADIFSLPAGLKSLETVVVGNPGNKADDTGFGAVTYPFKIGKFEVTAAQYTEFLNSKAKADPYGLYHLHMAEKGKVQCKIERNGENGDYTYSVNQEYANRPVDWVSYWDACRFANWLHNGQGSGDTETGAYTLNDYNGTDGRKIKRNAGAKWFVPSENEWYKAAYYDADKVGGAGYWDYPTRSDSKPNRDFAGFNAANYYDDSYLDPVNYLTQVGAFANSKSGYGTFDQGGNIYEWTEGLIPPFLRCFWGGSYVTDGGSNVRPPNRDMSSQAETDCVGFRIAGAVDGTQAKAVNPQASGVESAAMSIPRRPWRDPVNGKLFFPLGWFVYESNEADLDEIARDGGNVVLYIASFSNLDSEKELNANIKLMKKYLDSAHKRGIKVLPQLANWYGAYQRNDTAEIARQRKWVEALCKHPALLGYQLYDEPEYKAGGGFGIESQKELMQFVDALKKNRDAIREWDTNRDHMVQVVFNLVPLSSWTAYLPVIDSFQVDRYPCASNLPYFGQLGDWGLLMMAWSMAHGAASLNEFPHLHNPSPCLQGTNGANWLESDGMTAFWRNPLYEETRYMAYSSLTVGAWGVFHWIRNFPGQSNPQILMRNVGRLHAELRQLFPAFEQSYENPPFTVRHNHEDITRDFLTDCISDITTLTLEDEKNYYLIASDNSGVFEDVTLRMKLPVIKDTKTRDASVLNEDWSREIKYDSETEEWVIATHKMCFGDINIWVIPKAAP